MAQKLTFDLASKYGQRLVAGQQLTPILIVLRDYGAQKRTHQKSILQFIESVANATYQPGVPVYISALITDANPSRVEFRSDGALISIVLTAPFETTWSNPSGGPHSLTSTVIDAAGESATSSPVSIAILSPFENFRRAFFNQVQQANPAISGPKVDFDQDGYANFVEHFFGMNPTLSDRPIMSVSSLVISNQKYATFTFRSKNDATDVNSSVEGSFNLTVWDGGGDRFVLQSSLSHGDGTSTRTYRSLFPMGGKEYFRLRLTLP
ncbi:MAG: Ig-like domain-containing protein [Gloeobacteraceae cyanobacterium ES-bin-144]|nr:Ig-like domain-containing protein [Verrucomicrobiales bacterium]